MMIVVSLFDKTAIEAKAMRKVDEKTSKSVIVSWIALVAVMVGLYIFFNGN